MSRRVLIAIMSVVGLAMLAGCVAPRPLFHECGGNNCRNERDQDFDVVSDQHRPAGAVAVG